MACNSSRFINALHLFRTYTAAESDSIFSGDVFAKGYRQLKISGGEGQELSGVRKDLARTFACLALRFETVTCTEIE